MPHIFATSMPCLALLGIAIFLTSTQEKTGPQPAGNPYGYLAGNWLNDSDKSDTINLRFYPDTLQLVMNSSSLSNKNFPSRSYLFSLHNAKPSADSLNGIYMMWGGTSCTLFIISETIIEIAFYPEGRLKYHKLPDVGKP